MEVLVDETVDKKANLFPNPARNLFKFTIKGLNHSTPLAKAENEAFNWMLLAKKFENFYEEIKNVEVFPDDIWVISYPKCGTTWTQETVWQICNGVKLDDDHKDLSERFPFLE